MNSLFPYDNIIIGVLIFIVGFCFHGVGQFISIVNWELAERLGLQEAGLPAEYKVYEHAIAISDSILGIFYGIAAVGLIFNFSWGYKLAWLPGSIFIYHSLNFWFWTKNRRKAGHIFESSALRIGWFLANLLTGLLAITVAWKGY